MKTIDAVIVGAGPAGSAAAIALARRGYEVALVEKKVFPRDKLCGDFLNPINRPILRDLGVEEAVLAQPHVNITKFCITTSSGDRAEVDFTGCNPQVEPGLGLRRALLDEVLMQWAVALGVAVYQGRRIDDLQRAAGDWRVRAGEENWRARALIGADGRNSWVARHLGLAEQRDASGHAVGFQMRLQAPGATGNRIDIHLIGGGYAGLVGLGDGSTNLALALDRRTLDRKHDTDSLCDRVLGENPFLRSILQKRATAGELRSVYPVYFPARRSFTHGALLVGDAARVTEPVSGEGVYFALSSGLLAAKTLDRALCRGDLSASSMAGYERACRQMFRSRMVLNKVLRFAVYRPALLKPVIRLSSRHDFLLQPMIQAVCLP